VDAAHLARKHLTVNTADGMILFVIAGRMMFEDL
jgi:hypothetical protein